ncbi:unnamed protein product [Cyclocybe aegerita]|uniref:F-box domain-containing protein n=1 Tax=Cyclocybe aegerita TaxID=1973307 RepID=A0A8S0VUU0_CYCAE|nr:unnamed protein product [Cyclocybe aegerita]
MHPEKADRFSTAYCESTLRKRSRPTGYVLGAACKRWREIAHSTPHLWTTVVVRLKNGEVEQCAQFTSDWLSRTGKLPLTLDIYQPEGTQTFFGPPPAFDASPIFAAINAHSSQWETIVANIHCDLMQLLRGDGSGAPRLRTLDIATIDKRPSQNSLTPPLVFSLSGPMPRPTRVRLHQIRHPFAAVTWDSIKHLDIQEVSITECYDILQSGTNPVECYIEEIEITDEYEAPPPPQQFVLPHLRVLHLRWNDAQEVLLNALTLPSLSSLRTNGPLRVLPSLITRSGCKSTLTELILSDKDTTVFDLMHALENAPLLEQLSVSSLTLDDTLFEQLSSTTFFHPAQADADAQGVFLPHLMSLSIVSEPELFSFKAITSIFIPEREPWQEGWKRRPLFRFWLEVSDSDDGYEPLEWNMLDPWPIDPLIIVLLRAIKASGVDLRIYDGMGLDLFEYDERDN